MADLLKRLRKQNVAVDYIHKLLAAFREDGHRTVPEGPGAQVVQERSMSPQPMVEPLTNRELDILELLAQRLQSNEIAEKLFISIDTVKTLLKHIYQKLNVSNRRQGVDKANALGILTRR
jgi:LuxR family maltose regulon positive regulatory protein